MCKSHTIGAAFFPDEHCACAGLEAPQQLALPGPRRHGSLVAEAADFKVASDPALLAATAARAALENTEQDWVSTRRLHVQKDVTHGG